MLSRDRAGPLAVPAAALAHRRADGPPARLALAHDRRARPGRHAGRHGRVVGPDPARPPDPTAAAGGAAVRDARRRARRPDPARARPRRGLAGPPVLRAHPGVQRGGAGRRRRRRDLRPPAARRRRSRSRTTARSSSPARPWSAAQHATGDLGSWLGDRLVVHGRKVDTIVSGGENVMPQEVEAALLSHPAVREAGVFGRPDPEWGEAVTAFVVGEVDAGRTARPRRREARPLQDPEDDRDRGLTSAQRGGQAAAPRALVGPRAAHARSRPR